MPLTIEQEVDIFKRLAYKSMLEVGLEFKLDQKYKDNKAIRNAVMNIYRKVKDHPEKYGVDNSVIELVSNAAAHRNMVGSLKEPSKAEQAIDGNVKDLVIGVRDKSLRLLDTKLTRASKSKKALDALSIRDLTIVAGTMFDKGQIVQGQATEHIAVMGKIDGNIDPQQALELVLKMREQNVAEKAKK